MKQWRQCIDNRLFSIDPTLGAHSEMSDGMATVRNEPGQSIGIHLVRRQPAFIQPHHAREISSCGMAAHINPLRRATVGFNVFEGPRHRRRGVLNIRGRLDLGMQPVIHRHHRDSFSL